MKKRENLKSLKFSKNFEIDKNQSASVLGGTEVSPRQCPYSEYGNPACSPSCPDWYDDKV